MNSFLKLTTFLFVLAFTFNSCKKEGCMDSLAENYDSDSKKDDGSCTFARTKFKGAYNVNQECAVEPGSVFTMTVTDGPNADEILINNFGNSGQNIRAKVNGGNISFKEDKAGVIYEGTGYITGNILTINYEACETVFYPCSGPESCTMTGTK